ncbi:anthranilate synthase component II [Myroides pelagicus]|uniref:Anthranilate synthase component II n=1 Tax=Myroides pelagicus TaxID=270914 RepID=A0A7K1GNJ2_9FLAO|nr:aminodeoxychorismate/anthranilate synthase component II [Myroides pelagicus]MEC4115160.1 aminodeoxychorismate/anthranilate synthase component II [Myroides pelagicus]MTH30445.1 anthranilate synthase component II [Myroides pelagicus]
MSVQKQIVIIDNHDSFTYNLYQLFDENPNCQITVVRNDEVSVEDIDQYDQIVFSPGPDIPNKSPIMYRVLDMYKGIKPILGVCLGHQAIGDYFGARLINLEQVYHGQQRALHICDESERLFDGVKQNSLVGLYHSWALEKESFPEDLVITAFSEDGVIMGIRHRIYNISGIQFHPESYMTGVGIKMIDNWIEQ